MKKVYQFYVRLFLMGILGGLLSGSDSGQKLIVIVGVIVLLVNLWAVFTDGGFEHWWNEPVWKIVVLFFRQACWFVGVIVGVALVSVW